MHVWLGGSMIEDVISTFDTLDYASHISSSSAKREALYEKFKSKISVNRALSRMLVSFQANKSVAIYNWFKYKEGFSEPLVTYILHHFKHQPGILLDPFSGAGSALFAASSLEWKIKGIEVLPVGIYATRARFIAQSIKSQKFREVIAELKCQNFIDYYDENYALKHVTITRGAFPPLEEQQLVGYIAYCHRFVADEDIRALLLYAAFCILEAISYTRKDGQYLRWDTRSGRSQGKKPFNKGYIPTFREAVDEKLRQIVTDLEARPIQQDLFTDSSLPRITNAECELYEGSCLEILPTLNTNSIDFVLTSPPYANRYDYTRTYALELVYLGADDEKVKHLRQTMLSCTVENKDKRAKLETIYTHLEKEQEFHLIDTTFQKQEALQEILALLESYREQGKLNNQNIARMVHNYFYEMSFVIYELARSLKPGGLIVMVNDNVRYAGEEVPVDLILSDIAETFDLTTRHIWILDRGKGNSSQQMGNHGRSELRKCVYVWEKRG